MAAKGPLYSTATTKYYDGEVTFAVGMSYQDEVDLLEGIGVTVLPGPQVFVPPELHMMWLSGMSVCCVGKPDGSYMVQPKRQPAFVKILYTWALW